MGILYIIVCIKKKYRKEKLEMKQIKEDYKKTIKYFCESKIFVIAIILVTILSFGFTITNSSVGMDDTAFDRYYDGKEMLAIGRWGAYVIYQILNITEFIPFWLDFIAASVIMFTSVLWCLFLKKNLKEKLQIGAYIIFASVFISFPIINEIFIFENCNIAVMLGTFLASFGVMIFYENYNNIHKKNIYVLSALILTLAMSMYEACAQVMLISICITSILMIYTDKNKKIKDIFKYIFCALGIVAISVVLDQIVVKLIYLAGVKTSDVAEKQINWGSYGILESLQLIVLNIINAIKNIKYYPVLIFDFASIIGLAIGILQSDKNKNWMILVIFMAMFLSNFAISVLQLGSVLYRTCTSWGLFVAIVMMAVYYFLNEYKITKILASIAITILVLQQTVSLNKLFYNDYKRYQKDLHIAYDLVYNLEKNCDISKPLVIMGTPYKGMGDYGAQSNSLSVLWWGKKAFNDKGSEFIKFLNSLGYSFQNPTDEEYEKGKVEAENMERYPKDGSIRELEDCIIINF